MTDANTTTINHTAAECGERATIYYDGECPVCRVEIAFMRSQDKDGSLAFEDITKDGAALPPGRDRAAALRRFHVRTDDGRVHDGAAAFVAVWERMPLMRPLARFARVPGAMPVLEVLYRGFLRIRPGIQWIFRLFSRK